MNRFEQHPQLTSISLIMVFLLTMVIAMEGVAKYVLALGNVVLYDAHPVTGYRPQPNQLVNRRGHQVIINADRLRAETNWAHAAAHQRVLFLGDSVTYGGSYIDNAALFSTLATDNTSYVSGNAGVNGWGVLNIHALIYEMTYLPAETYITVLPEGDFYRGLNRIGGQPLWTRQPKYALEELIYYGLYKLNLHMNGWLDPSQLSSVDREKTVQLAAKKLKEMDEFIKSQGYKHYIFISPSKSQALKREHIDPLVASAVKAQNLKAHYILDDLEHVALVEPLYYDEIHLSEIGHQHWAKFIQQALIKEKKHLM